MKTSLPLAHMEEFAGELLRILRPHCERIAIAGSIRRQKAKCGDIELVAIPKIQCFPDLLGDKIEVNEVWEHLDSLVPKLEIEYLSTGKRYRKFVWQDIQVDFFTATPENWGWIFLIRTGSADFSHRMAKCLNRKGYTSAEGFVRKIQNPEKRIKTPDESDIFRLADVPWIEPKDRVQ